MCETTDNLPGFGLVVAAAFELTAAAPAHREQSSGRRHYRTVDHEVAPDAPYSGRDSGRMVWRLIAAAAVFDGHKRKSTN